MNQKENLLKSLSISSINKWINLESNETKKDIFRYIKSEKIKANSPKMGEVIKVIPDNLIDKSGFISYDISLAKYIEKNTISLERSYAEFDERYRQIVCNTILITRDNSGTRYFGFLERNHKYKESSLIGTIGMTGGHYNSNDVNMFSCLIREVSEEIKGVPIEYSTISPIGFIREVNNTVSNYHLCVLYCIEFPYEFMGKIKSKENQESLLWIADARLEEMLKKSENSTESVFDSWCEVALGHIF